MKPFAESSEQNKGPILDILKIEFEGRLRILEIGSGTGQHATYFAEKLPQLHWTCSDLEENHAGIRMWLEEARRDNIAGPLLLDAREDWPPLSFDAVFSANTIHIMSWNAVQGMIRNTGKILPPNGKLCLYGPFIYNGEHTAESNAQFDSHLKSHDPLSGIRDVSKLRTLIRQQNMDLVKDYEMPVNNRILIWQKYD